MISLAMPTAQLVSALQVCVAQGDSLGDGCGARRLIGGWTLRSGDTQSGRANTSFAARTGSSGSKIKSPVCRVDEVILTGNWKNFLQGRISLGGKRD